MKLLVRLLVLFLVIELLVYYTALNGSAPVKPAIEHKRPELAAIFNSNYSQYIDQFGTVARAAFDASGKRIGTQVGTYRRGAPNGIVVEMTYLQPDSEHPLGQAFDGAGNLMPLQHWP
jgi:hypothetical protein